MARVAFNATHVKEILSKCGFWPVIDKVKILKANNGQVLVEFKIEKRHTDVHGKLNVGFSGILIDTFTSCTLLTLDQIGKNKFSSLDMNISTINPAVIGDELIIDAKTDIIKKKFVHTNCEIRNKMTGKIISKGSHTLYIFT